MKRKLLLKASGIIAVAVASLAPMGAAHADFYILGNKVIDPVPGATTPAMDPSQYDKLEVLGNVHWIPKSRGAQGPMRSDTLDQARMDSGKFEKLDILDNVFWLPKTGTRY